MADETRMTRPARTDAPPPAVQSLPRRPADPDDTEAARAEIEATRARMSETIDEIEDALLRRKEEIREKLDVLGPVREQPVKTLGIIFGAALLLGLLTGGGRSDGREEEDETAAEPGRSRRRGRVELDDEEEEDDASAEEAALAWQRAEEWEDRAHRLLRIARAQETELEIHRERQERMRRRPRVAAPARYEEEDEDEDDGEPNLFERMRDSAADRLAALAGEVSHRMMRGG